MKNSAKLFNHLNIKINLRGIREQNGCFKNGITKDFNNRMQLKFEIKMLKTLKENVC